MGRDAQRGVMMEAAPAAPLIVSQAQFLFQILVIALDPPAQFREIDQALEGHVRWDGGQPVFDRLGLTLGHSINSHSSSRGSARHASQWAARTRTRAKREVSAPALA